MNKLLLAALILSSSCVRKPPPETPIYRTSAASGYADEGVFLMYTTPRGYEEFSIKNQARLVDKNGKVVYKWDIKCPPKHAEVFPGFKLAVACYTPNTKGTPGTYGMFKFLDKNSNVLWSFADEAIHHDFARLDDDRFFLIRNRKLEKKDLAKLGQKLADQDVVGDEIILVDRNQKITWSWDLFKDLDKKELAQLEFANPQDTTHGNSVRYYPANPISKRPSLLLSFRNISRMFLIDFESKKVIWTSPKDLARFQHDATLVNGEWVLFLDNGPHGADWRTSVKEVNIKTGEVKTVFQHILFALPLMGSVQKLDNGHYLIGDSIQGYGFEIDESGRRKFAIHNAAATYKGELPWLDSAPFFKIKKYDLKKISLED